MRDEPEPDPETHPVLRSCAGESREAFPVYEKFNIWSLKDGMLEAHLSDRKGTNHVKQIYRNQN